MDSENGASAPTRRTHFVSVRYCLPSARVTSAKNGCNPIPRLAAVTAKAADDWPVTLVNAPPVPNNSIRVTLLSLATIENCAVASSAVFVSHKRQEKVADSVEF